MCGYQHSPRPPGAEYFCQVPPGLFSLFSILFCFIIGQWIRPFFCCFLPGFSNKPCGDPLAFPLPFASPTHHTPRCPLGRCIAALAGVKKVAARACQRRSCRCLARSPPLIGQLPRPVAGFLGFSLPPPPSHHPFTLHIVVLGPLGGAPDHYILCRGFDRTFVLCYRIHAGIDRTLPGEVVPVKENTNHG